MKFAARRLSPPYRLINYRPLQDLLSAQFLFDLYDQFDPRVNVFRFRNVVGVFRESAMYTYAPETDWQYLTEQIARSTRSFAYPGRLDRLEQLFANKKERLHLLMDRFDRMQVELGTQSNAVLCDWLLELYYQALNEIFVMNLVPLEVGYYRRLLEDFREDGRTESELLLFIEHYAQKSSVPTVAYTDRNRLIQLARAHRTSGHPQTALEEAIRIIQDHSIGYGAVPRSRSSIEAEYQHYLEMPESELDAIDLVQLPQADVPIGHRELSVPTHQLLETYTHIGSLRDRNKALLGCTVRRRQWLMQLIAQRTNIPMTELRFYLLEELVELLQSGRTVQIDDRVQGVVLGAALSMETADRARNTAAIVTGTAKHARHLQGVAASAGVVEATARIVNEQAEVPYFLPGEVLVASGTDFHLLDAMLKASAVITVEGGILSHASVICRERGIPCIIGVTDALSRIQTGDRLQVNADLGIITLLSPPAPVLAGHLPSAKGPIGNKAEMLLRVQGIGLHVAEFVVLTEDFFYDWLAACGINVEAFRTLSVKEKLECICSLSPDRIKTQLDALIAGLGAGHLAVRSSAPYEDGAQHSYAGILKSQLFVPANSNDVVRAVKACWSALFLGSLATYHPSDAARSSHSVCLPLIAQKMVPAVLSGVLFTCDPRSGADQVVAEIVSGGCSEVTEGASCDETLIFDRHSPVVRSALLTGSETTQLQAAVNILCAHFGDALDVEWSFDASGTLFIHQVRPITPSRSRNENG